MPDDYYIDWSTVKELTALMVQDALQQGPVKRIVAVGRGGWIPAVIASHILNIRRVGTVECLTYGPNRQKLSKPQVNLWTPGARWIRLPDTLVIDDILDSGSTYRALAEIVEPIRMSVLVTKQPELAVPSSLSVPKGTWVVFPWEEVKSVPGD